MSALDGWIDVCRAGEHTDSRGRAVGITPDDIAGIARRYAGEDPAPVVLGHPKDDDPAYGWVGKLRAVGGALQAKLRKLDPAFREWVESGRYRGRSVALRGGPGNWSLRHLGFLGATPPAIEGLAPSEFAGRGRAAMEGEDDAVIEFAGDAPGFGAWGALAAAMARLRDLLVDKFSIEEADRALPRWALRSVEDAAAGAAESDGAQPVSMAAEAAGSDPEGGRGMSENNNPGGADASAALAEREAAQAAREAAAEAREAAFAARERLAAERAWADGQVRAGRVLPADAEALAAFLAHCAPDADIEFAAPGGGRRTARAADWLREWIGRLPARVEYGEVAPAAERKRPARIDAAADRARAGQALGAAAAALMAGNPALTQDQAIILAKAGDEEARP